MANLIQIKRSTTATTPGSLANGELAFTSNGNVLYIGSPNGSVVAIGGARVPGILTANQALVANTSGYLDEIRTANAVITRIHANGTFGTAGQLLTANSSGGVYWDTPLPSVVGSNTQVQFNDSGALGATAGFTFNKVSGSVAANNFYATSVVNGSVLSVGSDVVANAAGVYATGTVNASTLSVGSNFVSNSTGVFVANSVNATAVTIGSNVTANSSGVYTTGTVNSSVVSVGTDFVANSTGVFVANSVNATSVTIGSNVVSNTSGVFTTGTVNAAAITAGAGLIANGAGLYTTGTVNAAQHTVGSDVVANSSGVFATGTVNASVVSVGTSFLANTTRIVIGNTTGLVANNTIGNVGDSLLSNGSSVYWDTRVSSVATGAGLSGGPITTTGTIAVVANNGIAANSTGVFVVPGVGVTVNATGVHIGQAVETTSDVTFNRITATGNVAFGDSINDIVSLNGSVNTNIMPAANNTYLLGNNTMRWSEIHSGNNHSNNGFFDGSVQITGNLSVLGTTFTVSSNTLIIQDPMIHLAANNNSSDLLDIGFFANYNADGGNTEYTGLFRDHTVDIYRLFEGLSQEPGLTVNTAAAGYKTATLEAYLTSGGLISNGSTLAITANSTVNVAIVANTLTLSTALAGTSGGTGKSTMTNNAILVGNSTNGYNELTLGTAGYVLQSNGTALIYDILDGGTF